MAKNIYLLNESRVSTFTNHEIIDMQIRLSKVLQKKKVAIIRIFEALGRMNDSEIIKNKEEIKGTLELLNDQCVDISEYDFSDNGLSLDAVLMFWKEGDKYYNTLDKIREVVDY